VQITWGEQEGISANASRPVRAIPTTSISGEDDRIRFSTAIAIAESSTNKTRIGILFIANC
jgi:hypothetical protein